MVVAVLTGQPVGLLLGQELDALVGLEVILHPEQLVVGVDPAVGVAAVAVHVPPALRDAAVTHQPGHLVRRLRVRVSRNPTACGGHADWWPACASGERMKCWNFIGSRMKKTGVLLPTMSKLPSEV